MAGIALKKRRLTRDQAAALCAWLEIQVEQGLNGRTQRMLADDAGAVLGFFVTKNNVRVQLPAARRRAAERRAAGELLESQKRLVELVDALAGIVQVMNDRVALLEGVIKGTAIVSVRQVAEGGRLFDPEPQVRFSYLYDGRDDEMTIVRIVPTVCGMPAGDESVEEVRGHDQ